MVVSFLIFHLTLTSKVIRIEREHLAFFLHVRWVVFCVKVNIPDKQSRYIKGVARRSLSS